MTTPTPSAQERALCLQICQHYGKETPPELRSCHCFLTIKAALQQAQTEARQAEQQRWFMHHLGTCQLCNLPEFICAMGKFIRQATS